VVTADADRAWMARALVLAERGRGRTSPNPAVGALVVSPAGLVIGEGTTEPAGGRHAEIVALDAAGDAAAGATLYVTLEPCAHHGRTGPCAVRIAEAGVARVVAAVTDPNPLVAGQGFAYLRAHGVEVVEGVGETEARRQLAPFFTWVTAHRPFVIVKAAVSADGFVGREGERVKLTGEAADRHFHQQRAEVDAIAVGAGTVLTDDPQLTARGAARTRPLVRVIVDWRGRVPATARVFSTLAAGPVIMIVSRDTAAARPDYVRAVTGRGATVEVFDTRALGPVLRRLAARDIVLLLVEGGPALQRALAGERLVDCVQWIRTPLVLGTGIPLAPTGLPEPRDARTTRLGDDELVEFDVHWTD
jgi:diaminohydroxyphosphoribosylaminopyrimidine deaminase/5-amino-6-(5-phosphoribosylamino)uracil reductase